MRFPYKLTVVEDSGDRKVFRYGPMRDSDWPVWFFIMVRYMEDYRNEKPTEYNVTLSVAAPKAVSPKRAEGAARCYGMTMDDYRKLKPEDRALLLVDYGIAAPLYDVIGPKCKPLLAKAKETLALAQLLFGVYMDRPVNRIGDTGWDAIRGKIGERLARR